MNKNIYDKIINLPESGDIKKVIKKWDILAKRKKGDLKGCPIVVPDIMLYTVDGIGKSNLITLLVDYLKVENIIDFCGEQSFFEFRLEYCGSQEIFKELKRFHERVSWAAGFRSQYKGVICIELDEWIGHHDEKYFKIFIEYLEENADNWLLLFSINSDNEPAKKQMQQFLAMYFRIEIVQLQLPSIEDFALYIKRKMREYHFDISEKNMKILSDSIKILRESRYFDGYKSMNRLIQDIVYEAYMGDSYEESMIDEQIILRFGPKSEYIQRMKANYERKIGFRIQ